MTWPEWPSTSLQSDVVAALHRAGARGVTARDVSESTGRNINDVRTALGNLWASGVANKEYEEAVVNGRRVHRYRYIRPCPDAIAEEES